MTTMEARFINRLVAENIAIADDDDEGISFIVADSPKLKKQESEEHGGSRKNLEMQWSSKSI